MGLRKLALLGAAIASAGVVVATAAQAQNEQFIPGLVYRTGAYAPNGIPFADGVRDYITMLNERDGGINGVKISFEECETGYATDRGVECYERLKGKGPTGAAYFSPLSTGITFALTEKAPGDKVPLITMGYGRADSRDGAVMLKNADIAMYQAKESGRNQFRFFTEHMHTALIERHKLEQDIQSALHLKQFALVYQPKVDVITHKLTGMEALIRWNCPDRGLVRPAEFIRTAENSGYIVPLGYWIIGDVCRALKKWEADSLKVVPVSINVSVKQFQQPDFAARVEEILKVHNVDASLIELEMTEGLLMEDTAATQRCLEQLKNIGIRIAIDDFGTGNSCLAYLQKFPIDILKIDKSFVDELGYNTDSEHICRAIISLANALELETVAEGVETEGQLKFLREAGCGIAQGYLFGHPIWGREIVELLDHARNSFATLKPAVSFQNSETQNVRILNAGAKFLT